MAVNVGYNGSVKVGAAVVAEIGEWNVSLDSSIVDVTKFGDSWKDQLQTLRSWTGKATGRWDGTDTMGQIAIQNAYLAGNPISLSLYTTATHFYAGSAYVKSLAIKTAVAGAVDWDISFEGTGALSYT
jgi:predicted secreted protein